MFKSIEAHTINEGIGLIAQWGEETEVGGEHNGQNKGFYRELHASSQ